MLRAEVDVLSTGAVRLGSNVVCDGFAENCNWRVQTHLHADHMVDFQRSKGTQDFVMSSETFALLVAERNFDLAHRLNFHRLERGERHSLEDGSRLRLVPSNHMLGACQVELELENGRRLGYSGDFGWPLDDVVQVDELVVDSTYGSPRSVRKYSQAQAEDCLLSIVLQRLRHGPVHVKAHRGTIERVIGVLRPNVNVPILASERLLREVGVYQEYGLALGLLTSVESEDGTVAKRARSYVQLYSKGDSYGNDRDEGTTVECSAFMSGRDGHESPLTTYSERGYCVALSNHADFNETLAYVQATGATSVVTDNTRGHGVELALAIRERLPAVKVRPSSNTPVPRWT